MSFVPPIIDAMITIDNDAMVVWFTPKSIWRWAAGIRTFQKSCARVVPEIMPASIISLGTALSPRIVFRTIGGKA